MNVLIDTDCGTDDTFCIGNFLRLHKAGDCKVVGITTVCGNISAKNAYQTANKLVKEVFRVENVPVLKSRHSHKNDTKCSYFYGQDGHSGALSEVSNSVYREHPESSEDFITRKLEEVEDLTIIAIGPLTNLAHVKQGLLKKAKQILIMGGAVATGGNYPPTFAAEYNFAIDPLAAASVLSNENIVLFPLDITEKIRFGVEALKNRCVGNKYEDFFKNSIDRDFAQMVKYGECTEDDRRLNIHDVHTYIYYIHKELYTTKSYTVRIDEIGKVVQDGDGTKILVAVDSTNEEAIHAAMMGMFN